MAGQVICFSWPSYSQPWSYGRDAALCEESEDCFVDALRLLTSICNRQNLHILAHSMGNRLLLRGCHAHMVSGRALPLGQVIIAGPDVAQRRFRQLYHAYSGAKRRTMYSSKHDRALMGSRFLHARGRAGYIPPLLIVDDVDTIDTSVHGLSLWGLNHSAFGNTRALVTDIGTLVRHDMAPELRIGLDRRIDSESGRLYWACIP
jgi:esterase/lipase superfamily enzyme